MVESVIRHLCGLRLKKVMWVEVEEGQLIGPKLVQETTEKISQIKDRLKATRDRQKSYADKRRKPLEFSVGDYVLLKVSPWKGVVRFGKKGKLAPRFIGPFEIIKKIIDLNSLSLQRSFESTSGIRALLENSFDSRRHGNLNYHIIQDYALWEVIENGNSWVSVPQTAQENGTLITKMYVPVTAEEKANKKNNVKARSLLLMALPNEH
ncbi:hypothetical protein Tco_0265045 [Tanacetum coccineum]